MHEKILLITLPNFGHKTLCYVLFYLFVLHFSFNAVKDSGTVKIEWQTVEEKNNSYYEIQRSVDGINYQTITTVAGHKKTVARESAIQITTIHL